MTINKKIVREKLQLIDSVVKDNYLSILAKDIYVMYTPTKLDRGVITDGICLEGRIQRIKIEKRDNIDLNLN